MTLIPKAPMRPVRQHGSVVLIVMILLAVIAALMVANTRVLYSLDRELKAVEQRQLKKFTTTPAAVAPAGSRAANPGSK